MSERVLNAVSPLFEVSRHRRKYFFLMLSFRGFTQKNIFGHNEVMTGRYLLILLFDLHSLAARCIVFSNLFPSLVPKDRGIMSGTFFLRNVRIVACQRVVTILLWV